MATKKSDFPAAQFKFGMRQVVKHKGALGTVIGRAEHRLGEPTYLVRSIESLSATEGTSRKESELVAF